MLDLSHRQDLAWLAGLVADLQSAAPSLKPLVVGGLDAEGAQTLALQMNPTTPDDALKLLGAFHRGLLGLEAF